MNWKQMLHLFLEINAHNFPPQNWYNSTACNPQLPNCNQAYETFIE